MAFVYTPMPSTQCSRCIQAAIIQEALFNRIHLLEKQLYQALTDKDAAYRTILMQSTTTASSVKTSSISTANIDPICNCSGDSPLSSTTSSVPVHLSANKEPDKLHLPLIDLLGPIEQDSKPCVESPRSSLNPGIEPTNVQDFVGKTQSSSTMSKFDLEPSDAESIAYIRRFSGKLPEPRMIPNETGCNAKPENGVCGTRISDHMLFKSYSSSNDAVSERYSPETVDNSPNSSFTEFQGLLDSTHNVIPEKKGRVPLPKVDRPHWDHSNALKALLVALSSDERWEEYRLNISVKISDHLDITGIEQGAYHTVMLYNLSVDCTMVNVLDQVRGGMILDAGLLDTTTITGSMIAMLTFVESSAAVAFTEHVGREGLSVSGRVVRAFLVQVSTARIKCGQIRAINSHFHSRCLRVHNFPLNITLEELRLDLRPYKATSIDLVESMSMITDDVIELRFHSVTAAEDAFDLLTMRNVMAKYRQCRVVYGADPCAQTWVGEDSAARGTGLNANTDQLAKANFEIKSKGSTRNKNSIGATRDTAVSEEIPNVESRRI